MKKMSFVPVLIILFLFITTITFICFMRYRNIELSNDYYDFKNSNVEVTSTKVSNVKSERDEMVIDKNSRTLRDCLNISDEDALKMSRKIFELGITDFIELEDIVYSDIGDITFTAISDTGNKYYFHLKMKSLEIITISDGTTYLYNSL